MENKKAKLHAQRIEERRRDEERRTENERRRVIEKLHEPKAKKPAAKRKTANQDDEGGSSSIKEKSEPERVIVKNEGRTHYEEKEREDGHSNNDRYHRKRDVKAADKAHHRQHESTK